MPSPIELGSGIADTNAVPGRKVRSFHRILDGTKRITIDSSNRTITIEETGKTGALSAVVADTTAGLTLTGGTAAITALLQAYATDAKLVLTGAATGGVIRSVNIDTAAAIAVGFGSANPVARPLSILEIRDCEPTDPAGQTFYRLIVASARYRKT